MRALDNDWCIGILSDDAKFIASIEGPLLAPVAVISGRSGFGTEETSRDLRTKPIQQVARRLL